MDSAQYYIDIDDEFCLSHLPCLDDLLELGLTLFVDQIFPNYHDMTLTQYAAAGRKPDTFKLILDRQYQRKIPIIDIIFPKTSNTKKNLFELAIKFGTKGLAGDKNDIRCLKTLYDFIYNYQPDFDINFSEINCEPPLLTAIHYKNEDAIKFLLASKADLFAYKIKENEDEKTAALRMPIIKLFRSSKEEIKNDFDQILGDYKNEIIQKCLELKIDDKPFTDFLHESGLNDAETYLLDFDPNETDKINTLKNNDNSNPEKSQSNEPESGKSQDNSDDLCSNCKRNPAVHVCLFCKAKLCDDCQKEHNCQ